MGLRTWAIKILFLALGAIPSPGHAAGFDEFVSFLLTAFRTEARAPNGDVKERFLAKIPALNVKLLALSGTMKRCAAALELLASLERAPVVNENDLHLIREQTDNLRLDLERELREVADGIKDIRLPLAELNIDLLIEVERVFGLRNGAVIRVRVLNRLQLTDTIAELRRVSAEGENLARALDEFRRMGTGVIAANDP